MCQEPNKPRERSPSSFRVSGTRIVSCEIEVWCFNKLGGLPYSPNLEYIMLRLSPVLTSHLVFISLRWDLILVWQLALLGFFKLLTGCCLPPNPYRSKILGSPSWFRSRYLHLIKMPLSQLS